MKERPIIFSADSVRSILAGRKTQTRRVIIPWPMAAFEPAEPGVWVRTESKSYFEGGMVADAYRQPCPYGQPGDLLWVREPWRLKSWSASAHYGEAEYRADGRVREVDGPWTFGKAFPAGREPEAWRSPLHLPRWASRLTLEVVEVRVARLRLITEADAEAEGVEAFSLVIGFGGVRRRVPGETAREAFARAWDEINGKRAPWASNPWVWVLQFEVVKCP